MNVPPTVPPVWIPARFNGPPGSGNGGYSAGLFQAAAQPLLAPVGPAATDQSAEVGSVVGPVTVTLRLPPPLDTPLEVSHTPGSAGQGPGGAPTSASNDVPVISVLDRTRLIATVTTARPELLAEAVEPVGYGAALAVQPSFPGFARHPFPTCYVCGTDRPDGLRLFPGRLAPDRTATAWRVPAAVSTTLVWAALDCPGGWTVPIEGRPYLLGRITARIDAVPKPDEHCVITGRAVAVAGRKAEVLSTRYDADGRLLALARAVWIAPATS